MQQTLLTPAQQTRVPTKVVRFCTHSRLVDEVRNAKGLKTGELICMECMAKFPDPTYQTPQK